MLTLETLLKAAEDDLEFARAREIAALTALNMHLGLNYVK